MKNKKIVLIAGRGQSTNVVFNALEKAFGVENIIIEDPESRKVFIQRRIKKLGYLKVGGQILFQILIVRVLNFFSDNRKKEILAYYQLDDSPIPNEKLLIVPSINAQETIHILKDLQPDLIVVNGTRIISKKVLDACACKFINTHAGITPKYRGVHGLYWALVNKDAENGGVTIHFVDKGIDTGNVIYQSRVFPKVEDNFVTYPLLQLGEGIKILEQAIKDYFNNTIVIKTEPSSSNLWYHPTFFEYIYHRVVKNIK